MSLQGTQTLQNLVVAFAGESQARNRYTYYAKKAKKDGYEQIRAIFEETAAQEEHHAKQLLKRLGGHGPVEINARFDTAPIGSTLDNLRAAVAGEHEETEQLYPEFGATADQEGFREIAALFRQLAVAEKWHEARFAKLAQNIEDNTIFQRRESIRWVCRKCGYIHEGPEAPKVCALCRHPQAYFEEEAQNY